MSQLMTVRTPGRVQITKWNALAADSVFIVLWDWMSSVRAERRVCTQRKAEVYIVYNTMLPRHLPVSVQCITESQL